MANRVQQLARTTGTGAQADVVLDNPFGSTEFRFSVEFSTTGTVSLEGRIDNEGAWIVIAGPYTADTLVPIAFVPNLRLNIAANGGTIVSKAAVF